MRRLLVGGFLLALALAGFVSYYASSSPDGLNKVAEDKGFAATARDHDLADSPVADYSVHGVSDERLSGGLAGVIGVVVTFALGGGVFLLVRRVGRSAATDPAAVGTGTGRGSGARDATGRGTGARDATGRGSGARDGTGRGTGARDGTRRGTGAGDGTRRGTGAGDGTGTRTGTGRGTGAGDGDRTRRDPA